MGTEADDLNEALAHHRAGRLAEAAAGYRAVLSRDPRQTDALFLLGVVAHQTGWNEPAAGLFRQVLAVKPDHAACWNLLGLALAAQSDPAGAEESYRKAIALEPILSLYLAGYPGSAGARVFLKKKGFSEPASLGSFNLLVQADTAQLITFVSIDTNRETK
jgi:tetratricopeptide (TPR) repeat protein